MVGAPKRRSEQRGKKTLITLCMYIYKRARLFFFVLKKIVRSAAKFWSVFFFSFALRSSFLSLYYFSVCMLFFRSLIFICESTRLRHIQRSTTHTFNIKMAVCKIKRTEKKLHEIIYAPLSQCIYYTLNRECVYIQFALAHYMLWQSDLNFITQSFVVGGTVNFSIWNAFERTTFEDNLNWSLYRVHFSTKSYFEHIAIISLLFLALYLRKSKYYSLKLASNVLNQLCCNYNLQCGFVYCWCEKKCNNDLFDRLYYTLFWVTL